MKKSLAQLGKRQIHFPAILKYFAIAGLTLMTISLHAQSAVPVNAKDSSAWINVSESLGFPLGGVGTGYSTFGRSGFVRVSNMDVTMIPSLE